MPKYWVKNYFAHGRFPEVGQKQKTEKKKERKKRERERKKFWTGSILLTFYLHLKKIKEKLLSAKF